MRSLPSIGLALLTSACVNVAVPEIREAHVPERAPDGASTVLFVMASPDDPQPAIGALPRPWRTFDAPVTTAVDVLDESGELLGRLQNRTWLAIERPPGPATFYAVSTHWTPCANLDASYCPPSRGVANVALLRAELEEGRVHAVWLGSVMRRDTWDTESPCVEWTEVPVPGDMIPAFVSQDLVAVEDLGWNAVSHVLEDPSVRAMRAAPRGLVHPHAEAIRSSAEARVGRCWDRDASTLRPSHGRSSPVFP